MSQYQYNPATGRYSPPPRFDRPPFPPNLPSGASGPPPPSFPPFAPGPGPGQGYGGGGIPPPPPSAHLVPHGHAHPSHTPNSAPPAPYRPYDPYGADSRPSPLPSAYPQPRDPYAGDSYDPYTPSSAAYSAPAPPRYGRSPPRTAAPLARLPPRPPSPSRRPAPISTLSAVPRNNQSGDLADLPLLTAPTTATIAGFTTAVYALPPSHLPLDKYIAVNPDDCIDIHRALCRKSTAVWYADGSTRAGEGWASAIEWVIERGQSGRKMRGSVPTHDALDVELAALCKAVEGFQELLHLSIKDGTPMSHELIIFCDSAAAIVAIDTSSRPESIHFERLWRAICTEFLRAHITLVWLPKNSGIEGHMLADKIAVVAASNSYLKRKKENALADQYRRPGGGDPAPGASTEPGPWQRGDADPGRRKSPFERPKPLPVPVAAPPMPPQRQPTLGLEMGANGSGNGEQAVGMPVQAQTDQDQNMPPPREAVFVTNFPDELSAKDLGVLYAQFGDLVSVDIYHTDPRHPRFAYVQYNTLESGDNAISTLHDVPIDFGTEYAQQNAADLEGWGGWQGTMTVVRNEPGRFIPIAVEDLFPGVAAWMVGGEREEEASRKREREGAQGANGQAQASSPVSHVDSPSPHKRVRVEEASSDKPETGLMVKTDSGETRPPAVPGTPAPEHGQAPVPAMNGRATPQNQSTVNGTTKLPLTPHTAERPAPVSYPLPARPIPAEAQTPTSAAGGSTPQLPSAVPASAPLSAALSSTPTIPSSLPVPSTLPLAPAGASQPGKPSLTNSAAEPQEYPVRVSNKTLGVLLSLVQRSFPKHDRNNWIAHSCLIAVEMDQARRALQADLFATDEGFINGRALEQELLARGFTAARVDAFVPKVLKVLDGIAAAEGPDGAGGDEGAGAEDTSELEARLEDELAQYTDQTREGVRAAGVLMEYLMRGKGLQEKKRLDVERRVKVLEGMVKIGEVVGGVVRFLLTDGSG